MNEQRLNLLLRSLQAVRDSDGNLRRISSLLADHLEILDVTFAQVIQDWVRSNLPQLEYRQAQHLGVDIARLCRLLQDCPFGDSIDTLEIAIAGYEALIENIFVYQLYPEDWAITQVHLGDAYADRTQGNKADNLERSRVAYEQALRFYTRHSFPVDWATIQLYLGTIFSDRIQGDRVKNLEQAIQHYQNSLLILTPKQDFEDWAVAHNHLGIAYCDRTQGDRSQNLEEAIKCYELVLKQCDREQFSEIWAMTQNNLGTAYYQRLAGHRASNLESAITAFQAALQIYTQQDFPQDWAMTQNNLGDAYCDRLLGDRAENLEVAIQAFQFALQIYNLEDFPDQWAMVQNNLGTVYRLRIQGDPAENIETALSCFQQALQVYRQETSPQNWAIAQGNRGNAYMERIWGDTANNLEQAIASFQAVLQTYSPQSDLENWARVQNKLGTAYHRRISQYQDQILKTIIHREFEQPLDEQIAAYEVELQAEQIQALELAISTYQTALKNCTQQRYPEQWAEIQNNLGNAYRDYIGDDRAENLEQAIVSYNEALKVYDRQSYPERWALLQNNLGDVYAERSIGNSHENLVQAIRYHQAALSVYTESHFPKYYVNTQCYLGLVYQRLGYWNEAYNAFFAALETVEYLRGEVISGDFIKQRFAGQWTAIYISMIRTCWQLASTEPYYWVKALEYIERNKARNLVELVSSRELLPKNLTANALAEFRSLQQAITAEQQRLSNVERQLLYDQFSGVRNAPTVETTVTQALNYSHLNQLRQHLYDWITQEIGDTTFELTQQVKLIAFQEIQKLLLDDQTALIEWYFLENTFLTFIVTRQNSIPLVLSATAERWRELIDWSDAYLQDYMRESQSWSEHLQDRLQHLSEILDWKQILKLLPKECDRLILIPHRFLHLFPLHAVPISDEHVLLDHFSRGISYAPSCQLLQISQKQIRSFPRTLFAVQNPTGDLVYADLEIAAICSKFSSTHILVEQEATKEALKASSNLAMADCIHFACHGVFNLESPLSSALLMNQEGEGKESCLTLEEIVNLDLSRCRLVTLSACETGLTDFTVLSDEYVGLPQGFLIAGSLCVVSSLWRVSDISTVFLMAKFYDNWHPHTSIAAALNQAQRWLRDATGDELKQWMNEKLLISNPTLKLYVLRWFSQEHRPFENPYHWAAFCAIGE